MIDPTGLNWAFAIFSTADGPIWPRPRDEKMAKAQPKEDFENFMATPKYVYAFLAVGLFAASQSGNIIRIGDAPPLVIAAWRLLFASALLAPLAGKNLALVARLSKKDFALLFLAAIALAGHFFTWIAAVQMTTVANASIFFSVNPVFTALGAYLLFGEEASSHLMLSIGLGIAGIAVISSSELGLHPENLLGDAAAVLCALLFTAYFLIGKRLRQQLPTTAYVVALYGVAAFICFTAAMILGIPLVGYSPRTWLCFGLMALLPTLIGHTSFNNALRYLGAGHVSAATLCEPMLAGIVAYFAWGESLFWGAALGYIFICGSVLVLAFDQLRRGKLRPGPP